MPGTDTLITDTDEIAETQKDYWFKTCEEEKAKPGTETYRMDMDMIIRKMIRRGAELSDVRREDLQEEEEEEDEQDEETEGDLDKEQHMQPHEMAERQKKQRRGKKKRRMKQKRTAEKNKELPSKRPIRQDVDDNTMHRYLNSRVTLMGVKRAVAKGKSGTAPGEDEIPYAALKHCEQEKCPRSGRRQSKRPCTRQGRRKTRQPTGRSRSSAVWAKRTRGFWRHDCETT